MKIIFTAKGENWDSDIDERFGRANIFFIYNEENDTVEIASNSETEDMGHGAGLQSAKKAIDLNPNIIITGNGAGSKALDILKRTNIKMYTGAGNMTLKEAYEAYKKEKLQLQF